MREDSESDDAEIEKGQATASAEAFFKLYVQEPDESPVLYHYTSPKSLVSIVDSQKIYATNIRYLNDASEYIFTRQLFVSRIAQFVEDASEDEIVLFLEYLQSHFSTVSSHDGDYYVVSFSTAGDVLSQWRGYCPPEGGYSVGFSFKDLTAAAKKKISLFPNSWRLVKCEYDGETQFRTVDNVIRESVEAFQHFDRESRGELSQYLRKDIETVPAILNGLVHDLLRAVGELAPVFKHQAFADEEEWRLVSPRIIDGDTCIKFRGGGFSVVPFVYFELPPVRECIVGPTVDQHLSARAVEQLCDVPVSELSTIPYRFLT